MTRGLVPILAAGMLCPAAFGAESMSAAELAHELDRIATTGRVLYVAAHPDDENTRLLAFLANERHLRVAYLSMTRGGGGQNLIGAEQGDLLDVIRTEELLAARRIDGAQQRFTRMRDFGYSKTAAETLSIWGHDEALADVVWVIRSFQPDVIITRFDEDPPNHGHHTASAILAREAFTAAADPKRFPEQIAAGFVPWQADRLLRNHPTWRDNPVPKDAIPLDVGAYDVRRGMEYGELAALSRSQHRSQGFGVPGQRGAIIENFVPVAGTRPEKDVFEGLDFTWRRFGAAAAPLIAALDEARASLERDRPEKALPALARAHAALDGLAESHRAIEARWALEDLIRAAAGLFVRATAATPIGVPGTQVKVDVELVQRRPAPLKITLRDYGADGAPRDVDVGELAVGQKKVYSQTLSIPPSAPVTTPLWLTEPPLPGRHRLADPHSVGEPLGRPALRVGLGFEIDGRSFWFNTPVVQSFTDPVLGERIRPFLVVPPATVTPSRDAVMLVNGAAGRVVLRVRAGAEGVKGDVSLQVPAGWTMEPASRSVTLARAGDETTVTFDVRGPAGAASSVQATPVFTSAGRSWSYRQTVIDYPHIPYQLVLQPASLKLVPLSIALPRGTVGYIRGSGDTVADDLAHVGLQVETLDDEAIRSGDLSRFAAIVVGIRAYNTRDVVRAAQPRLMEYVERGGTVVVQYNTSSRFGPLETPIGPFPLEIGRDRVTDEKAAMTLLAPDHPLATTPNRIVPADFEGWVQERGLYFASKWDERYTALFAANDPGEEPLRGSTVYAPYGKGHYLYSGLAFFRQLPAGVPGAYRLLVNFIAAGRGVDRGK